MQRELGALKRNPTTFVCLCNPHEACPAEEHHITRGWARTRRIFPSSHLLRNLSPLNRCTRLKRL